MYDFSCELLNLIVCGSKIIQINVYNFDEFRPCHTFWAATKFNIPLKVPNLLALGHNYCPTHRYPDVARSNLDQVKFICYFFSFIMCYLVCSLYVYQ